MAVGRIFKSEGRFIIDAEPHVMSKVRNLFKGGGRYWEGGEYTHKPISIPNTMDGCRDISWIMQRYCFDVEKTVLDEIEGRSDEYEKVLHAVANYDQDKELKVSKDALKLTYALREHQTIFNNVIRKTSRVLLADKMGLGKTISGLSLLVEPERRPALIIVPPTLCTQWADVIGEQLPDASFHVIKGFKNYELPDVDIFITSYNRLKPWQDVILDPKFKIETLIFDEVHDLRRTGTDKREFAKKISERTPMVTGLTGTPIYNKGDEIWSVLDVINPNSLGDEKDFRSEWCSWDGQVNEPTTLNKYLKNMAFMMRREPSEVGLNFGKMSKQVITIDADLGQLEKVQDIAKTLALSVLSGKIGEDSEASREFDWKLRHATGVAKAKSVAEFVKILLDEDEGRKILLSGWHRDYWDIINKELARFNPVMFTGSETTPQKDKAKKSFIEGNSRVFLISSRSGAGIDGLQKVCDVVVHGELDWSPHVMDQINSRIDRDGQKNHVNAYYVVIKDGSDPFLLKLLNLKRSQHDGLVEGKDAVAEVLQGNGAGMDRIRDMAKSYLESIGEEVPDINIETGLLKEVSDVLRAIKIPNNDEDEMQRALVKILPEAFSTLKVEREVKISKRSRVDFMISNDSGEKIVVECKINSTKRADVYRQVRRYAEELSPTGVVIIAPWAGINSFLIDETPVSVVDFSVNSI